MAKCLLRTLEFAVYHLLIFFVHRLSRLPDSCPPGAMRLYRENLALKVQLAARLRRLGRRLGMDNPDFGGDDGQIETPTHGSDARFWHIAR